MTLYAGDGFELAGTVLAISLVGYPAIWASAMYYRVAYAIGRIVQYNITALILSISMAGCTYYLIAIEEMGAPGAALGIAVPNVVIHLFLIWPMGIRSVGGTWAKFFRQAVIPGCAPFLAAIGACLAFGELLFTPDWTSMMLASAVSAITYVSVLLACCLAAEDKDLLRRAFAKLRRAVSRR
jgi:hypothetical protein